MKTLHVFVPLFNKSFTGEMKNCVAAESNKYPVVYRMLFPGVKRPERGVDHPPYLAPRLMKD
jgi:hypothetical protein